MDNNNKEQRIRKFGEVFTPSQIIESLLENIDYSNPDLKFCEPSFGDGRILKVIKNNLLKFHSEQHIIENMLYGIEIQEHLYSQVVKELNADKYHHNLYHGNALNFENKESMNCSWVGKMDYVVGNPPYNRNILKKSEVTKTFWDPSGYTTKLAYCCFVVLANFLLKEKGKIRYVIPCSFTHNENTIQFREYLRDNLKIESIDILNKDAFEGIMIRTCIFKSSKEKEDNVINLTRIWNDVKYTTTTFYNEYNEIPLFLGDVSKSIYQKVVQNKNTLTAYKGWNGVDSYSKYSSKDENKYQYKYVDVVKKDKIIFKSTMYKDKTKAKKNKKKNNVGNYDRFNLKKIFINEILFGSFEAKNHIRYIVKDSQGKFGASPLQTVIVFEDEQELDSFVSDLRCKVTQCMLTIMKDYNHNDSKLFRYIPKGICTIQFDKSEIDFLENFEQTSEEDVCCI